MGSSLRRFIESTCTPSQPCFSLLPSLPFPWRTPPRLLLPRPSSRPPSIWLPPESTSSWPQSTTTSRPSRLPMPTLMMPRTWLLPRLHSRLLLTMLLPEVLPPSRLLLLCMCCRLPPQWFTMFFPTLTMLTIPTTLVIPMPQQLTVPTTTPPTPPTAMPTPTLTPTPC